MTRQVAHITGHQRLALRVRLLGRARVLAEEIGEGLRSGSLEETAFDAPSIEQAGVGVAAVVRDTEELREVERALARLEAGDYGLCIDCGTPLPYVRLDAVPEAARCLHCEEARERLQGKPHTL
jgi:RNA polymerase-binding transcription factor DksA